jgi:TATA-binding protein-associated factor Taf7
MRSLISNLFATARIPLAVSPQAFLKKCVSESFHSDEAYMTGMTTPLATTRKKGWRKKEKPRIGGAIKRL